MGGLGLVAMGLEDFGEFWALGFRFCGFRALGLA